MIKYKDGIKNDLHLSWNGKVWCLYSSSQRRVLAEFKTYEDAEKEWGKRQ